MKQQYKELAEKIVSLLGGVENLENVTNCVTRLRFNVKDKAKVRVEEIKKLEGVINTNWASNQLQVIIGTTVGDAMQELLEANPELEELHGSPVNENLEKAADNGKKSTVIDKLVDVMTGCFAPIVPLLMGVGLLKVILMVLTMTNILPKDGSTYAVLSFCADAGFYFLPIFVAGTTAKYFGGNVGLAYLLGAILIHPTYVANYQAGTEMTLFGIKVFAANYTSTVFPSVLSVIVMCYVQKFFAKHAPKMFRSIIEPLGTLLVMIPLTLLLIGPFGSIVGTYVSAGIVGIYHKIGFLGVGLMAALYPILVLTGMHRMFMPYQLQSFSSLGYEPFYIASAFISNFNQGIACLVVALKAKQNLKMREMGFTSSFTAIFAGISEPAMYGVTTRYKKAFASAICGNAVGGVIAGLFGVVCYAYPGSAGMFGLPAFLGEKGIMNVVYLVIAIAAGCLTTFLVGMAIIKPEEIQ